LSTEKALPTNYHTQKQKQQELVLELQRQTSTIPGNIKSAKWNLLKHALNI